MSEKICFGVMYTISLFLIIYVGVTLDCDNIFDVAIIICTAIANALVVKLYGEHKAEEGRRQQRGPLLD